MGCLIISFLSPPQYFPIPSTRIYKWLIFAPISLSTFAPVIPNDQLFMRKFFTLLIAVLGFGSLSAQCSDLFFSEYIEGSSSNKALEIYNPTGDTVDLSNYVVARYNNGSTSASDTLVLQGQLAPMEVFVIGNAGGDAAILAESDITSTLTFYNGDDAIALFNILSGDTLDIIGIIGVDPGTNWAVGAGATSEFTLVRSDSVTEGSTDWAISSTQWDVFPQNTFDSLGTHTAQPCQGTMPPMGGCATDLFFSEYIEGSSSNKALEIYNPTGNPLDLTDYVLYRFNNGATSPSDSLFPFGTLAPGGVYIVGNPGASPSITSLSDTLHSMTFYNGDDAIVLINSMTGDTLDIIGVVGVDPGSGWTVGSGATNNFTLVRMSSVQNGTTDWNIGQTQWDVFPIDTFDSLGVHTMVPCSGSSSPGCTDDIFISEYIEGLASNKALEIYNPMDTTVDLSNYALYRFNNGSATATDSLFPQGMLMSDDVFVIGNPSSNAAIMMASDTTHSLASYNGDDAIALINLGSGDTLDIIGVVGEDPGTNWTVDVGATSEFTLVRKFNVRTGETNWMNSVSQWDVFPQDFTDSLGMHSMNPCGNASTVTEIAIVGMTQTVNENGGSVDIDFMITPGTSVNPADSSVADLILAGGTATAGADFTFANTSVTFPYNQTMVTVTIPILDDAVFEGSETFELMLQNATNNALITNGMQIVTILDDEVPTYPIGTITTVDSNGVGDSLNVTCFIEGVVYGVDLRGGNGIQFTVIDPTGGIGVFSFNDISNYTVQEGDSIKLRGSVGAFNGLIQMNPDSIQLISTGNPLKQPTLVTQLGENTESDLIVLENVTLVNAANWGTGGSFNVDVTNGTDTFTVRIDGDVDISGLPAPVGAFDVCGIGGQFDNSSPFTSGYQLLPRYVADIKPIISVELGADTSFCGGNVVLDAGNPGYDYLWSTGDTTQTLTIGVAGTYSVIVSDPNYGMGSSDTIVVDPGAAPMATFDVDTLFSNAFAFTDLSSANPTSWMWSFGDGATDTIANPTHTYTSAGVYTVTLVVMNACGSDTTTFEIDLLTSINEAFATGMQVYPNPTEGRFMVKLPTGLVEPVQLRVLNLYGQEVLRDEVELEINEMELSGVAKGIYFLEANYLGQTYTSKVVLR